MCYVPDGYLTNECVYFVITATVRVVFLRKDLQFDFNLLNSSSAAYKSFESFIKSQVRMSFKYLPNPAQKADYNRQL